MSPRLLPFLLLATAAVAPAQTWVRPYEQGLAAGRAGKWGEARDAFLRAVEARPNDASEPSQTFGPLTERRRWRDGAPYSANFLAAFAGAREALVLKEPEQSNLLRAVGQELERLVEQGRAGRFAVSTLIDVYNRLGDTEKRAVLQTRKGVPNPDWREDLEIVSPEALAGAPVVPPVNPNPTTPPPATPPTTTNPPVPTPQPGVQTPNTTPIPGAPPYILGGASPLSNKFALVVGNSESKLPNGPLAFAGDDAISVREALQNYGGYPRENVEIVVNGTAEQIRAAANSLAARLTDRATVAIYFTGVGVNLGGKDYLAGVDTELPSDIASMLPKEDLYRAFVTKGALVFSFFQVARPIVAGRYFGAEIPTIGSISQMQATTPGDVVRFKYQGQKAVGLFTDAFVGTLTEFRTNQIPILDFGWQVFYRVRRGDTGTSGGSSLQTPTLPYRSNLAADARF